MQWEPHTPRGGRVRVHETSCCGEYELASEAGVYFVLRWTGDGYEESERGLYAAVVAVWQELATNHRHKTRTAP